jgi:hypothetical protein
VVEWWGKGSFGVSFSFSSSSSSFSYSSSSSSFVLGWGSSGVARMEDGNDGRFPRITRTDDDEHEHEGENEDDWEWELVDITDLG